MATIVSEVMTHDPVVLDAKATAADAANAMRDQDIGAVVVRSGKKVSGIVTDRDIVVRAVASGHDPRKVHLDDICSGQLTAVSPGDTLEEAVNLMREKALRRLPVLEDGSAVGMVSIGDLAMERDPQSALADISAARPNT